MKAKIFLGFLFVFALMAFVSAEDVSQNSPEKDLVANGFSLKNVEQGVQILLDYEERGLGDDDDYFTEIYFNGKMASRERREALELNGPGMNFWKMLRYKLTFSDLVVMAKMDYVTKEEKTSSNKGCSNDLDCAEEGGLQLCIKGHCTTIGDMDNFVKEANEDNNCIQQKFKIKLFDRQLIPVSSATSC